MTALLENLTRELNIDNIVLASFQDVIAKASDWDGYFLDNISHSLNSRLNVWLYNHPTFAWVVHHPLISLVIGSIAIVLVIRLLLTIYRAIASTIDRMWVWILRSPWILLKFLFGWEVKPKDTNTNITNYEITNNPQQLEEIMTRLGQIQQQQQQIMHDLELLKGRSHSIEAQQVNLTLPAKANDR